MADLAERPNLAPTQARVLSGGHDRDRAERNADASYGDSLESQEIWALVYYLHSLVPPERQLSPGLTLGEESRGWMAVRMGRIGPGGMMHRIGSMPMM
jgi:hypothetical protein